jgi:tRNA threonylcarbamoyladenosine biosynthesis protein TsaB
MTGRVLAVDTTSEFGSIAIAEDCRVVEEVLLHSSDGFAHLLFPAVQALLERHGWPLASIDCFAAAAGPGSFTGVRVGLAAMKGLAETLGRPVAAVSNLRALATLGSKPLRAVFFDARRGEIYGAVYSASGGLVQPETVQKFPEWLAALPSGDLELITPQKAVFAAAAGREITEAPRALAGAIALLAEPADPLTADANYVRRSDAELFWVDK